MKRLTYRQMRKGLIELGLSPDRTEKFLNWHNKNPLVMRYFERLTLKLISSGKFSEFGAMTILGRVRYDIAETTGKAVKLSNNWAPYYARAFIVSHPEHKDFFKLNQLKEAA